MVLCKWGSQQLEGPSWDIWLSDDIELSSALKSLSSVVILCWEPLLDAAVTVLEWTVLVITVYQISFLFELD